MFTDYSNYFNSELFAHQWLSSYTIMVTQHITTSRIPTNSDIDLNLWMCEVLVSIKINFLFVNNLKIKTVTLQAIKMTQSEESNNLA